MSDLRPLPSQMIGELVGAALSEDWGRLGDITSAAVIEPNANARGVIRAREEGVLAGLGFAQTAFTLTDKRLQLDMHAADGENLSAGTDVMTITGPAIALLSAERVALNFLGHMSGIALSLIHI